MENLDHDQRVVPHTNMSNDQPETAASDIERQANLSEPETLPKSPTDLPTASEQRNADSSDGKSNVQLDGWRLYTVQVALCLALFLGGLDSSIVATALVTIGRDFNNFIQLQWIVLAYLLTELAFAFIFSRISDIVGRKWATMIGVAIITISSLACGLAQSLIQLIIFRAFQGVGGAGVYAMPFTVLPEITPPKKFAILSALSGFTFVASSILGPTLGGVITTQSTWRWIFYFNVPFGVVIMILILFAWPNDRAHAVGHISWREFDLIGSLLSAAALVLLIFALQEGGAEAFLWSSRVIVAALTLSGVAAVLLFFWIWYLSHGERLFKPLFPARIVVHRVLGANALISVLIGYVLFTVLVELSERLQLVNGKSAQTAGIDLLPFLGSAAVASGLCGFVSREKNRSFYTLTFSAIFVVLGCGLLSSLSFSSKVPKLVYFYQVILGLGVGGTLVSTILTVKLNAGEEDAASAQGIQSQARILGGNIGLALATIILNIHLNSDLKNVLTPTQIADVRQSLNAIEKFSPAKVAAVADSFARAFRTQLQVCTGVAGVSLLLCLCTWQKNPPTFVDLGKTEAKGEKKERKRREKAKIEGSSSSDR